MVKEKSEIRVIVSQGKTKLKMPDLEDYDIDNAKTILKSLWYLKLMIMILLRNLMIMYQKDK